MVVCGGVCIEGGSLLERIALQGSGWLVGNCIMSVCAAVPPTRRENNTGRFPRGLSLMLRSMAGEGTVYCLWGWPGLLCTA